MNERIRELWYKAAESTAAYPSGQNNSWKTQVNFMDEFAQLIVKECLEQVRDEVQYEYDWKLADAVTKRVMEHFGVKE